MVNSLNHLNELNKEFMKGVEKQHVGIVEQHNRASVDRQVQGFKLG